VDSAGDTDLGEDRDQVLELHQAIRTNSLIDRAQGLLMAIHGCDGAQARTMLTRVSQAHHVSVHDLARAVDQADAGTGDPTPAMVEALFDVMTSAAGGR
jgi:hypothetical protein